MGDWRDSYDSWKLATPPEYEITEEEERQLEMEHFEEKYGELADLIGFAYANSKFARDDREVFLRMARILTAGLVSTDLKDAWAEEVGVYAPPPRTPPPTDDDIAF